MVAITNNKQAAFGFLEGSTSFTNADRKESLRAKFIRSPTIGVVPVY